jgi:uncharacterized membrane protein required for colicin V production
MWSYIIDGLVIGIILVCAIIGIFKGLFSSVLGLISTALALVVSAFTAKFVSPILNNIFGLEKLFTDKLASGGDTLNLFGQNLPASDVAKFCVWIITVILIFAIIKLVVFVLAKLFEKITQNSPTMNKLNRILGCVFGLLKGVAFSLSLIALFSVVAEVPVIGTTIKDGIANTKVTSIVYETVDNFVDNQLTTEKVNDIISKISNK